MTQAPDSPSEQELPRELREALDSMTTPDPRPEFRSKLRGEFVAGEIRCSDTMVEAALDQWDAPPAREEFRNRCREAFLSAAVDRERVPEDRGKLLRFLPLAAAAAVMALLIPELLGGSSSWEQLEGGPIVVDGKTVAEPTGDQLEDHLRARGSCSVDKDCEKRLMRYLGTLLVEVDPGTVYDVDFERSAGTNLYLELEQGAMRVSGKPGVEHLISITTPDAEVVMRGEAIGVDVIEERGTCVCCLEGDVEVDPVFEDAEKFAVQSGSSIWIPRASKEIKLLPEEVHHREPLELIRKSARTYFY
jgi:hypothetical protein